MCVLVCMHLCVNLIVGNKVYNWWLVRYAGFSNPRGITSCSCVGWMGEGGSAQECDGVGGCLATASSIITWPSHEPEN